MSLKSDDRRINYFISYLVGTFIQPPNSVFNTDLLQNTPVRALQGRMALQRGPIVYCLEGVDHGEIVLDRISIDPQQVANEFQVEHREDLLGSVTIVRGKGKVVDESGWENNLYRTQQPSSNSLDITAIPYYAWDNSAPGEMRIWIRASGA